MLSTTIRYSGNRLFHNSRPLLTQFNRPLHLFRYAYLNPNIPTYSHSNQFSTASDKLNEVRNDLKSKLSDSKSTINELKGELKGKAAEVKGEIKGKIAEKKGQMKAKMAEKEAENKYKDPTTNNTTYRTYSTTTANRAGNIKPGELVESQATENRNVSTTDNASGQDETMEEAKQKQPINLEYQYTDATIPTDMNIRSDPLRARNIENPNTNQWNLNQQIDNTETVTEQARTLLNDVKSKSQDLKESLPTIDTSEMRQSIKEKASNLKEALQNSEMNQTLKEKAANLADKAKTTFQSISQNIKNKTMDTIDSVEETLGVNEAKERLSHQSNKIKQSFNNMMDTTADNANTADASPELMRSYENEMRFGAGRLIDAERDERINDDSINPADINLSDEAYQKDRNVNIDVQHPDSIANAPDTNIQADSIKTNVAGEDLIDTGADNLPHAKPNYNDDNTNNQPKF